MISRVSVKHTMPPKAFEFTGRRHFNVLMRLTFSFGFDADDFLFTLT